MHDPASTRATASVAGPGARATRPSATAVAAQHRDQAPVGVGRGAAARDGEPADQAARGPRRQQRAHEGGVAVLLGVRGHRDLDRPERRAHARDRRRGGSGGRGLARAPANVRAAPLGRQRRDEGAVAKAAVPPTSSAAQTIRPTAGEASAATTPTSSSGPTMNVSSTPADSRA